MKNLKILAVLVFFTGLTYWGVEPYAHHIMHPHVEPAEFDFKDLDESTGTSRGSVESMIAQGDVNAGRDAVMANCTACHTVKSEGLAMMSDADLMAANGLLPPDLSNAGSIYDSVFLFNFIKDPVTTAFTSTYEMHKKEHLAEARNADPSASDALIAAHQKAVEGYKAKQGASFTKMPGFSYLPETDIANIVAFLKSIAKPIDQLSNKEVTVAACARCHSVEYDKIAVNGDLDQLAAYLGSTPPDLSMMIRSKGEEYLHNFINDPQKLLLGTGMPRVGLNEAAQAKVVAYLDKVGDPVKEERGAMGIYFIIFGIIFTIFAWAWKKNEMDEVH